MWSIGGEVFSYVALHGFVVADFLRCLSLPTHVLLLASGYRGSGR